MKRLRVLSSFLVFALFLVAILRNDFSLLSASIISLFPAAILYNLMKPNKHIRGKRKLSYGAAVEQLEALCRRNDDEGLLGWGGVKLTRHAKYGNFLFQGGMGTGKTISLYPLMYEAFKDPKARALLHDFKMVFPSFLEHIGIPKERIKILNPFDRNAYGWDIQAACKNALAADAIGESLAACDKDEDNFFDGSAQILISMVAQFFMLEGKGKTDYKWNLRDVILAAMSRETMREMFGKYEELEDGLRFVEKPNADVERTITRHIAPLKPIAALWQGRNTYDFRNWTNTNDILVIGYDARFPKQSGKINSLFLRLAMQSILSQQIGPTLSDSYFFLEEFPRIFAAGNFDAFMSTAREYRGSVTTVIQSVTQVREIYRDKTDNILQGFANKAFFQCSGKAAAWASECCGKAEVFEQSEGDQLNAGGGYGTSTSRAPKDKTLVTPDEFEQLPLLRHDKRIHGYFITSDLNNNPYYHRFSQSDLAHIWKEDGYPAQFDQVPDDDDSIVLKKWEEDERVRLGLKPKEENKPETVTPELSKKIEKVVTEKIEDVVTEPPRRTERTRRKLGWNVGEEASETYGRTPKK